MKKKEDLIQKMLGTKLSGVNIIEFFPKDEYTVEYLTVLVPAKGFINLNKLKVNDWCK